MRRRRWFLILALAVAILGTLAGCLRWIGQRAAARESRVYAWILCEECDRGERARVVALGDAVVPLLESLLRNGPSAERTQQMKSYLAPLARAGPGRGPVSPTVLASILSDYELLYRVKAASALSGIGGAKALHALCDARGQSAPNPAVKRAIDTALARRQGGGTCR